MTLLPPAWLRDLNPGAFLTSLTLLVLGVTGLAGEATRRALNIRKQIREDQLAFDVKLQKDRLQLRLDMEAIEKSTLTAQLEALRAERDRLLAELARAAADLEAAHAENRTLLARIDPQVWANAAAIRDLKAATAPGPLTWAEYNR
jgi:chromosome segregation ATPase